MARLSPSWGGLQASGKAEAPGCSRREHEHLSAGLQASGEAEALGGRETWGWRAAASPAPAAGSTAGWHSPGGGWWVVPVSEGRGSPRDRMNRWWIGGLP